jgi:hypothetical protein
MRDDAVTTVVAALLVLAVIVTFFSVYSTMVLPALKAQAEADHIHTVEEAFCAFDADVRNAVALRRELCLSEPVPLGGGDIIIDPLRSAGTLRVRQEAGWVAEICCNGSNATSRLVNVSYSPVSSFWQDQGYTWQYGYVNVTKGGMATPLSYLTMAEVRADASRSGFPAAFLDIDDRGCYTYLLNATTGAPEDVHYNCTALTLSLVTMVPSDRSFVSGNGGGTLVVNTSVREAYHRNGTVSIRLNGELSLPFNTTLRKKCEDTMARLGDTYDNIVGWSVTPEATCDRITLTFADDAAAPEVVVRTITLTVSAR